MLLRVVAAASAGAIVGACSGSTPEASHCSPCGSVGVSQDSGSDDGGEDAQVLACGGHVCGSIALPTDSGPDADAEAEASLPCGTGVCGSIVQLDGGDQ
jgi:hypothetical protein